MVKRVQEGTSNSLNVKFSFGQNLYIAVEGESFFDGYFFWWEDVYRRV